MCLETESIQNEQRLSDVVETLRARLEEASQSLSGMEEERARLEKQVESREEEIARLGRQAGSDTNIEKVLEIETHVYRFGRFVYFLGSTVIP